MKTIERRCTDGDLAMSDAMPFCQHYEARTTYPLKECLNNQFFLNVRGRLRSGDRINIVRYDNDTWKRVIECVEGVRIVAVDSAGVEIMQMFAPMSLNEEGEVGVVVGRGWGGQYAIRVDGTAYATRNTVVEANEYAEMMALETGKPLKIFDPKSKQSVSKVLPVTEAA